MRTMSQLAMGAVTVGFLFLSSGCIIAPEAGQGRGLIVERNATSVGARIIRKSAITSVGALNIRAIAGATSGSLKRLELARSCDSPTSGVLNARLNDAWVDLRPRLFSYC